MNVRVSAQALRFRVSQQELEQLLQGAALTLSVALPAGRTFVAQVRSVQDSKWQLSSADMSIMLAVPSDALQALSQSAPRKEGLEHTFAVESGETVQVSFEVDVFKESRRKR